MEMTFAQYINNPMGVKNAVYSNREMYRNLYMDKLDKILLREVGKVKYTLYLDKKKDRFYIHFKIPSEPIKDFYYDTVIEFYTTNNTHKMNKTLNDYYVKFYSNDPSFVFTFAHAMHKNDLFIKDLTPVMSSKALRTLAKEKNPKAEVGYVKSIYFAYLLSRNYGLFNKVLFETYGIEYNKNKLIGNIEHADKKIDSRIEAQEEESKKKRIKKSKEIRQKQDEKRNILTRTTTPTTSVKSTNITRSITKTKKTKKIGKG